MQKGFRNVSVTFAAAVALFAFAAVLSAQPIADNTVATVSDGSRTELITLSDLRWQLALMPNVDVEPATSDNLNRALQLLINQRLFALEAERIPQPEPTQAEMEAKIHEMVSYFPSTLDFVRRLQAVGFTSIEDDNFQRIVRDRVAIDKYLAFRFRAFIVITPAD